MPTSTPIDFNFNNRYHREFSKTYTELQPSPLSNPQLVCFSADVLSLLNLPKQSTTESNFIDVFSGNHVPVNAKPLAQKYTGHQFGHYNPDLGDGRGLLLGEVIGVDNNVWDLHLKGSGQTPYSRQGDGRAVLRSSIREFLASEALHHLGIPTSRALCVIAGQNTVWREQEEKAAITTRVCESHIRFGHFEYLYHSNQISELTKLMDFCIAEFYPECRDADNVYYALLERIVERTAIMIAKWQAFGFCHGVMNTDNMSILGITFDFGPFAFLDSFDSKFICNHSDHQGRYAFDKQPSIGLWNLNCLAHAFTTVLSIDELKSILAKYEGHLVRHYAGLMRNKFGFESMMKDDQALVGEFLQILENNKLDYTIAFRCLSDINKSDDVIPPYLAGVGAIGSWLNKYRLRLKIDQTPDSERKIKMDKINPKYILRNYLAQEAIAAAQNNDYTKVQQLHEILINPYCEQGAFNHYAKPAPEWAKELEISCSS